MQDQQSKCSRCGAVGAEENDSRHLCISTSSTMHYHVYTPHAIKSVTPMPDGTLEIVRRYPGNMMFYSYPPRQAPDRIVKEVYGAKDGKVVLLRTVEGKHFPAEQVPERIEFSE